MEPQVVKALRSILHAQTTPCIEDDLRAHVAAVAQGETLLPTIRKALLDMDWSQTDTKFQLGVLTALLLVAYDINERFTDDLCDQIVGQRRCSSIFKVRIRTLRRFTLDDFQTLEICGVRTSIAKALGSLDSKARRLQSWMETVPPVDLEGLSRLYITTEDQDEYWGYYVRIIAKIALIWRGNAEASIRQRLATELTLYHEIGHHVHHSESWDLSREQKEAEADEYAMACFAKRYPILRHGPLGRLAAAILLNRVPGR